MLTKVAFLVLAFTTATYSYDCTCYGLRSCLEERNEEHRELLQDCVPSCKKFLPGKRDSDRDIIQKCIDQKRNDLEALRQDELACLMKPAGGVCVAPRTRRQVANRDQQTSNVEVNAGGIQATAQTQINAEADAEIADLKAYFNCIRNCVQDAQPASALGAGQGVVLWATAGVEKQERAVETCSVGIGCSIKRDAVSQAATVCRENANAAGRITDIKRRYCSCIKSAGHKDLAC